MTALAELVATLPAWVRWGPVVFYPCLALGTLLPLTWLLESWLLRPLARLPARTHWSERARVGFPARIRLVSWALTSTVLVAMAWVLWLGRLTPIDIAIAPAIATLVATSLAAARVARVVAPERPRLTLRGLVGLATLTPGSLALLALACVAASDRFDLRTGLAGAAAALLSLAWAGGIPVAAASRLGLFWPPTPRLETLLESAAARAGVAVPPTSVAELPMANAFALVPANRLLVTKALLDELPADSLAAVLDHEVAHFRESGALRLARLVSSLVPVPLVLVRAAFGSAGLTGVAALAACIAALGVVLAIVRARLERAQPAQAAQESERGAAYARVLERIHELNGVPAVMRGVFAQRSSLYDRMTAAGSPPSFARPEPPPRLLVPLLTCFVLALGSLMGTRVLLMWAELAHGERLGVMHFVLATTGGDANAFEQLGYARFLAGDLEGATTAYEAAAELDPEDAEPRALVARLRILSGDCWGASGAAWEASVVADRSGTPRDREIVRRIRRELERCEPR